MRYYSDPLDPGAPAPTENQFVSETAYAELVQKTVIACTDAIVTLSGDRAVYLAKRSIYPMKGVWVLGGRIFFNDATLADSVARCIKRETSQEFAKKRFRQLPTPHLYSWIKTAQGEFPGRNLAITFHLDASEAELENIGSHLTGAEYEQGFGIQRYTRERLLDEKCHPALLDLHDDIFG
jgi:hypothetical protein